MRACPNHGTGACEIIIGNFERTLPVRIGDVVARGANGEVLVIATPEQEAKDLTFQTDSQNTL